MKSRLFFAALALGFLMVTGRQGSAQEQFPYQIFERYLEPLVQQIGMPGLSAVIVQDNRIAWSKNYGYADVERQIRTEIDTPYPVGGITQAFTGVLMGVCIDRFRLDIDLQDIRNFAPAFPLAGTACARCKPKKEIYTDYTISLGEPDKMAADALRFANMGFPVIKVKVGGEPKKDIERVKAIRKAIGKEIPLRIDANQGWNVKDAIKVLKGVKDCDIQFCEEPIARWNYMKLRKLRKNSPIPIMSDETCGDEHDAARLVELGACDMFNIKLGKCGGLYNALKIINIAEANAMPLQIGGFTESRLGITAEAHLAHVAVNILYYDFDTPLMFTEDPVSGGAVYGEKGLVTVTETPGLAATIDAARLEKMERVSVY